MLRALPGRRRHTEPSAAEPSAAGDGDPARFVHPEDLPPGGDLGEVVAEAEEIAAAQAADAGAAAWLGGVSAPVNVGPSRGRRGPGQPGSARPVPGVLTGPAAGFAAGHVLDSASGCAALMSFAEDAAGPGGSLAGVSDDELAGLICAWDRIGAAAAAGKYAAVAELVRRRPDPDGTAPWEESTPDELSQVLAETRAEAHVMLGFAEALAGRLPGTWAALRDGIVTEKKARIIYYATLQLTAGQCRRAVPPGSAAGRRPRCWNGPAG